ncbi:MAG: alanyl-tRNA editing protein [Anaerolineales bacterium]
MTLKLYHQDSYLREFSSRVTGHITDQHGILLDQTAFYPGGGGQPADHGWLEFQGERLPLKGIKQSAGEIIHILDSDAALPPVDSELVGIVDWDRRYQLMRTHTAMHILCGTVFRDYGALVTGGNMEPLKGRMDFEFASLQKELVELIENAVNNEVDRAHAVSWRTIPRQEAFQIPDLIRTKINLLPENIAEVRVVEIAGLDLQADGGTHVSNTREVGAVRITDYKSKGRDNKRIYLELNEN